LACFFFTGEDQRLALAARKSLFPLSGVVPRSGARGRSTVMAYNTRNPIIVQSDNSILLETDKRVV
jgi:hypothetical protein